MDSRNLPSELWLEVLRYCDLHTQILLGAAFPWLTPLLEPLETEILSFIATGYNADGTRTYSINWCMDSSDSDSSSNFSLQGTSSAKGFDGKPDVNSGARDGAGAGPLDASSIYGQEVSDEESAESSSTNSSDEESLDDRSLETTSISSSREMDYIEFDSDSDSESQCSDRDCREDFVTIPCYLNQVISSDDWERTYFSIPNFAQVYALLENPLFRENLKEFFLGTVRQYANDFKYLAKAINLASKAENLRLFHVTLPDTRVSLKFDVSKITQMTISRPFLDRDSPWWSGEDLDEREAYESLHTIFQFSSLRTLHLGNLEHFTGQMPEKYRQLAISNIESLYLFDCNHPSVYWRDIFAYPKNLKELKIDMCRPWEDQTVGENYTSHDILASALEPLHETLETLRWTFRECAARGMSKGAMTGFSKLSHMTVDLGMLLGNQGGLEISPRHALQNILPRSLKTVSFPR